MLQHKYFLPSLATHILHNHNQIYMVSLLSPVLAEAQDVVILTAHVMLRSG